MKAKLALLVSVLLIAGFAGCSRGGENLALRNKVESLQKQVNDLKETDAVKRDCIERLLIRTEPVLDDAVKAYIARKDKKAEEEVLRIHAAIVSTRSLFHLESKLAEQKKYPYNN